MAKYEIVYIIHPDLEGTTEKITEKIKILVKTNKGEVKSEENWGKRKLAYPIMKNSYGIYQFLTIEMPSEKVREVERALRLSEEIIRFLVVVPEVEMAKAKAQKKKTAIVEEKKVKPEPKKTAKEEKERLEEIDKKLQAIIGDESK